MTLNLHYFPHADSMIHRLDPRWKLAAIVLSVIGVALLKTLPTAAAALCLAMAFVLLSRLPVRWYLTRVAVVGVFVGLFALAMPFTVPSADEWRLGPVTISLDGVLLGLRLLAKTVAILTLMLVLLATTRLEETFKAAHSLRVPGLLVQLAMLTVRYTFLFGSELARTRVALRVRGYRNRVSRHIYRTVGHVAGTFLVRGYERAERVGQAMRCRGFDGQFRSVTRFRTRLKDVVFLLIVVCATGGLVAWDWCSRPIG
jgi:cobalt/nickel transport system permease protein